MMKNNGNVDATKYVVLDVETNGLSAIRDDLLSISIYKPDTEEIYDRLMPLELNDEVKTTSINGIKTEDLDGLRPLTQEEVNTIIEKFELKTRIILTYGSLDERFINKYFKRHNLVGIDFFSFYNFKHEIISSRFAEGNITKDYLATLYGIENITKVHSGINDCIIEWKLYEALNGHHLIITGNKVFEFNDEYFVPASFLNYNNMKYYQKELLKFICDKKEVFSIEISGDNIFKLGNNGDGLILEHLINSELKVQKIDSREILIRNKSKLNYIGELPKIRPVMPLLFNADGSVTETKKEDEKYVQRINNSIHEMQKQFQPLISFIKADIFKEKQIKSQEMVSYPDKKILALCDLSTDEAILEIKSASYESIDYHSQQLYYEANGRRCFVLMKKAEVSQNRINYTIYEVSFKKVEYVDAKKMLFEKAKEKIDTDTIKLIKYDGAKKPVRLKCKRCENEWSTSYSTVMRHVICPVCGIRDGFQNKNNQVDKIMKRFYKAQQKLDEKSNNNLQYISYRLAKEKARVKCKSCGFEWETIPDHLIKRAYCRNCGI
ncbi:MAG: hypothetical protein IIY49_00370 [Eubacterium sp.]|nr:hypothetical protein [Eubacterium sp.]